MNIELIQYKPFDLPNKIWQAGLPTECKESRFTE